LVSTQKHLFANVKVWLEDKRHLPAVALGRPMPITVYAIYGSSDQQGCAPTTKEAGLAPVKG
jgi:hypothetical protein